MASRKAASWLLLLLLVMAVAAPKRRSLSCIVSQRATIRDGRAPPASRAPSRPGGAFQLADQLLDAPRAGQRLLGELRELVSDEPRFALGLLAQPPGPPGVQPVEEEPGRQPHHD